MNKGTLKGNDMEKRDHIIKIMDVQREYFEYYEIEVCADSEVKLAHAIYDYLQVNKSLDDEGKVYGIARLVKLWKKEKGVQGLDDPYSFAQTIYYEAIKGRM